MSKKSVKILFSVYLFILTWGILFKFATHSYQIPFFMDYRYVNLIPFAEPLIVDGRLVWEEMVFNLVAFLPFGFLLPMVKPRLPLLTIIVSGFTLSLVYEMLQYLLAIGMADVTDLLMNTFGTCCGQVIYCLISKQFIPSE